MTVREALELLELSGIRATIADDAGDRYGAAGWIMDRPVARIVVVPELEAAGVPPAGGLAAAVDEIESRLVGDLNEIRVRRLVGDLTAALDPDAGEDLGR